MSCILTLYLCEKFHWAPMLRNEVVNKSVRYYSVNGSSNHVVYFQYHFTWLGVQKPCVEACLFTVAKVHNNNFCGNVYEKRKVLCPLSLLLGHSIPVITHALETRFYYFLISSKILHFKYKKAVKSPIFTINWLLNSETRIIGKIRRI